MTLKQVGRLRVRVGNLRRTRDVKSREMVRLAKAIGREPDNRTGKEPTYVHSELGDRRPLSIPNHPTLAPGTKNNILDDLEGDLDAYEEILTQKITTTNGKLR
ncbi:MAG: type II toxin-antitoxin system HicA family toxin [Candidatus Binatus sp.]|uniref:type II toxin-antitoxin system HicA family toxin n=1 Tax=Candidatus Binatus sp. TaxID=2811406 RepID=UPI00271EFD39|nr:type II toxin-antitoxin system HicA family toxin [Candidatus Binatus sp.]MDO8432535.1 type II toxin-antitoxin system HicA family toxin [Candidatus Binatus sp.]